MPAEEHSPAEDDNLAAIRELLLTAFSTGELWRFCLERPTFRPALSSLGQVPGIEEIAEALLEYCQRQVLLPELLSEIETTHPIQFEKFRDQLWAVPEDKAPRVEGDDFNLDALRSLILLAFTAKEFRRFLFDRPEFRSILDHWGPEFSFEEMVDVALEHCSLYGLCPELLEAIRETSPRRFAIYYQPAYESQIGSGKGQETIIGGRSEEPSAGEGAEGDLAVTRYGRLQFPARAPLRRRCRLAVTINRERLPDVEGQIELELTAGEWPLKVVASLVGVRPQDFLVEGPNSGVVEVPQEDDSEPLTFTLIPQSLGEKKIRVRFEQDNTYLGTAILHSEVVEAVPAETADAEVEHPPVLASRGLPPDLTLYIEEVEPRVYAVSVRTPADGADTPPREIDRIQFPQPPAVYMAARFKELDDKTKAGLSPQEFDAEVKKIGNNLYDDLFHDPGFKSFYWQEMEPRSELRTVQIVSEEPYIPWEILRPFRQMPDGTWQSDLLYLCQRFALSRWLAGPGFAHKLPLTDVVLVSPPSNLAHVQEEIGYIQEMLGLEVQRIEDKPALERFLQTGATPVLHFACHGLFNAEDPSHSAVILGDRYLRPDDLTAENRNFGRVQPLVFLNACDSGRLGIGLTGLDGWAEAFLRANAGFFVGSMWKTTDRLASKFARAFYERLQLGEPIGEAMRYARRMIEEPGDATHLSYTLYANPRVRAARAVE